MIERLEVENEPKSSEEWSPAGEGKSTSTTLIGCAGIKSRTRSLVARDSYSLV